jgi:thiamine pyrophosphokinase
LLGIIFTGGQGPSPQIARRLIETEAKEPLFIAADSGLDAAESTGVKPDWIIGDMDSIEDPSRLAAFPQERVIRHKKDKDYTDTELAFMFAVEKGADNIWIIGGGGGRIDHLFGIRSLFEREIFPRRWITESADIHCIDADLATADKLCRRVEKGSTVSVFPLGDGNWEAKSSALKWQLEGVKWERGLFGLSNVAVDGDFSITAQAGRFMVILPLSDILR